MSMATLIASVLVLTPSLSFKSCTFSTVVLRSVN